MNYDIIVMSCDKNLGLLDCFFKYFSRYFNCYEGEIYLGLEHESYEYPGLNIRVVNSEQNKWSGRLSEVVRKTTNKALLLMLDDFIIESTVDNTMISYLVESICVDNSIAHFALTTVPMENTSDELHYGFFYERSKYGRYKTTLQCGIWNREELISLLNDNESAWEVELFANTRSFVSNRKYYALCDNKYKPIDYNDGFFCIQGKINSKEKERLETVFNEPINISGLQENNGIIVRDDIKLIPRIERRLKIIGLSIFYKTLSIIRTRG